MAKKYKSKVPELKRLPTKGTKMEYICKLDNDIVYGFKRNHWYRFLQNDWSSIQIRCMPQSVIDDYNRKIS